MRTRILLALGFLITACANTQDDTIKTGITAMTAAVLELMKK
jgi:pectin methylesterase-like acyl-CoA thioesterase